MPAFASKTLEDSVPTGIVFSPSVIDASGVAKWYAPGDTFDGRPSVSLSAKLPKVGGSVVRITAKAVIPVMNTSVSPEVKIGECIANVEFVLPKTADATQRADLLAFAANLMADADVVAAVNDFESVY